MAKSIGIDLGTTNSAASIKKVRVEILKNAEGEMTTPSCVTVKKKKKGLLKLRTGSDYVVGEDAREWLKQDPENTITAVKRLMGRSFHNPEVQKMIDGRTRPYRITEHNRGTANSLAVILDGREHTPEEISSKILQKLKSDAETSLEDAVEFAVITVPAYFNDKQKHATRTAAALAGLKVRRLLPEPTAAAISFGVDEVNEDDAKTALVFDFGGGTFDLSVLTISGGQFIEQGKGGDMWLGGEDIDAKIADLVLDETAREWEIEDIRAFIDGQASDVKNRFAGELKASVERAKIRLSDEEEAYIEIPGVLKDEDGDRIDVDVELTRERFEEIMAPIIDNAVNLVRSLLRDIHFTPDMIDDVLLVGGSSRIPAVGAALVKMFGEEKVKLHERPMLAIAEGAAILSHRLSDSYECPRCGASAAQSDSRCAQCDFDLEKYIIEESVFDIVHSAAHDYYIHLENNERHLMIEKNTPLPCERTEAFTLVHPDQSLVHMKFFNIVNDNEESIGDLWLGIDDHDQEIDGPLHIDITLAIDENNLAAVTAALKELPEVGLSETLSRGKADEKLFQALEDLIEEANRKEYDGYQIEFLTERSVFVIKDIQKVIDKETGEVAESAYERAEMKIEKAGIMAEKDMTSTGLRVYVEDALNDFSDVIPPAEAAKLRAGIANLKRMDEHGALEENIAAYEELDDLLYEMPMLNMLMRIEKAGTLCDRYEPSSAGKFYEAIRRLRSSDDEETTNAILDEILPRAFEVTDKYDSGVDVIHKGITR
ncbi:MAG: Hsp70 family protein [Desulfobacterales bacterium]|nr:Hsp70 family protein [Desulfobacterales bacterium]